MYAKQCALLALSLMVCATARSGEVHFSDSFPGKLGEGWKIVREDPAGWRIKDGALEIRVQPGNMWGGANNARNVFVRSVPDPASRPVEVTVHVENAPTEQYEQVDLVWYYDDSHMVKIGQELVDGKLSIVMGREEGDRTRTIVILPLDSTKVQLRFAAKGNRIEGSYRTPSGEWVRAGECDLPVRGSPNVSLQVYQGPGKVERWARVQQFEIRVSNPRETDS